jgi:hypothetical protein
MNFSKIFQFRNFVASPPPEPPLVISIPALAQIGSSCWDSLEIRRGFHRQTNDGTASQEHAKCQQHHRQIVVEGSGKETAAAAKEVAKPARQRCCRRYWIVLLLVLLVVAGLLAVASLLTNLYNSLSNELVGFHFLIPAENFILLSETGEYSSTALFFIKKIKKNRSISRSLFILQRQCFRNNESFFERKLNGGIGM